MSCSPDCDCICGLPEEVAEAEESFITSLQSFFDSVPFYDSTPVQSNVNAVIPSCGNDDCFVCTPYPYGQDFDGVGDFDYSAIDIPIGIPESEDVYDDYDYDPDCECDLCVDEDDTDEDEEFCDCSVCEDYDYSTCNDEVYDRLIAIAIDPYADAETSLAALSIGIQMGVIGTVED